MEAASTAVTVTLTTVADASDVRLQFESVAEDRPIAVIAPASAGAFATVYMPDVKGPAPAATTSIVSTA